MIDHLDIRSMDFCGFFCPACDGKLRLRTVKEIVEELMASGMTRLQAQVMLVPRTGGMPRYWCDACEREYEIYSVFPQCLNVEPLDGGNDG